MVENCRRQHCQLTRARNAYLHARQYRRQRTVRQRLRNFCINKKQNGILISREDRMLINVLHQEKGSRKLLAEFPNKAF